MAKALPGDRLRPHVKAHKCTALAARRPPSGHTGFTCATVPRDGGHGPGRPRQDLLLANEVADASRLGPLVRAGVRVTLAVDSAATIAAAARGGVPEVLIDVNVGLPRCGCRPDDAGSLADARPGRAHRARGHGLRGAHRGARGPGGAGREIEDPWRSSCTPTSRSAER